MSTYKVALDRRRNAAVSATVMSPSATTSAGSIAIAVLLGRRLVSQPFEPSHDIYKAHAEACPNGIGRELPSSDRFTQASRMKADATRGLGD
jgi:hypothetical protein